MWTTIPHHLKQLYQKALYGLALQITIWKYKTKHFHTDGQHLLYRNNYTYITKHFWKLPEHSFLLPKGKIRSIACTVCIWKQSVHCTCCCNRLRRADKDIPFNILDITLDAGEMWGKWTTESSQACKILLNNFLCCSQKDRQLDEPIWPRGAF